MDSILGRGENGMSDKLKPETLEEILIDQGHPDYAQVVAEIADTPEITAMIENIRHEFEAKSVTIFKAGLVLGFHRGVRFVREGKL